MKHLDLFSGIGGFALAADHVWPGIEHTFCEIDPFCRAILKKHWPKSKIYGDIKTFTNPEREGELQSKRSQQEKREWLGDRFDILTGGFPCQPFSQAGRRQGTEDDRHLWPQMCRVIQEFSPTYVVAENVRGLLSINGGVVFESVCADLEALGYEVQPFIIPACAVNAPHRRDRVWIVAHKQSARLSEGGETRGEIVAGSTRWRGFTDDTCWNADWPTVAARLCTLDDGLSARLVRPRGWRNAALKAAGNAIVPQVAEQIFRAFEFNS